jgi:hypothetical protein
MLLSRSSSKRNPLETHSKYTSKRSPDDQLRVRQSFTLLGNSEYRNMVFNHITGRLLRRDEFMVVFND